MGVRSLMLDCGKDTPSSYSIECSVDGCGTDVWPSCEDKTEKIISSHQDATWEYTACKEVHIDYLNKSVSCGKGGWKTGTLRRIIGKGVFSSVSGPITCEDCDEQTFEWTLWTNHGQTTSIRTRGSVSIPDSSQIEEKPDGSPSSPSCMKTLTTSTTKTTKVLSSCMKSGFAKQMENEDREEFQQTSPFNITKNNQLTDLPFMGKEYTIFFEIFIDKLPTAHGSYKNVLLLTKDNCRRYFPRFPGIWIHKVNATHSEFHITQEMNGTQNDAKNVPVPAANKWIKVEVSQTKVGEQYMFESWIDGEKLISKKKYNT